MKYDDGEVGKGSHFLSDAGGKTEGDWGQEVREPLRRSVPKGWSAKVEASKRMKTIIF